MEDSTDALLASWAQRRPDLAAGFEAVDVITRLLRLRGLVESNLHAVFKEFGLGAPDFTALVTLERISDDAGVTQQRLADELGLTAGTVSVRIDQLVTRGLAERRPDPGSKRSTLVRLTAAGTELFEQMIGVHLANEERMLASLDPAERQTLTGLLRKLLVEFEGSEPAPGGEPIGLVLTPAHVAIAMRDAVGLPRVAGLLVRSVAPASPAARAGLQPGDILTEMRSASSLYEAIRAAAPGPLTLAVLRGADHRAITLAPATAPAPRTGRRSGPPEHVI